jgi:hypothetical protein
VIYIGIKIIKEVFGGLEYKLRKIDLKFYGIYLEIRHGK